MKPLLNWLSRLAGKYRQRAAQKRLDQLRQQTANSYEVIDFRKRRAAALKGHALRRQKMEAQG